MISANAPDVWTAAIDSPGNFPVPFCYKCTERIPDNHYTGTKLDRIVLQLEGEYWWLNYAQ